MSTKRPRKTERRWGRKLYNGVRRAMVTTIGCDNPLADAWLKEPPRIIKINHQGVSCFD